jgi:hypothetical protein
MVYKNIAKTVMVTASVSVLVLGLVVLNGWASETINVPVSKPNENGAVQDLSLSPTTQPLTAQAPPQLTIPSVPRDAEGREQARREAEAREQTQRDAEIREQAQRDAKAAEAREKAQREARARERAQREAATRKQTQREERAREQTKAALEAAGIIALSPNTMNWRDARAFCESKGGRLPRVIGHRDWGGRGRGSAAIEVFGAVGSPWPSLLPSDRPYWTGTRSTVGGPDRQWDVRSKDGRVDVGENSRNRSYRVVCVP